MGNKYSTYSYYISSGLVLIFMFLMAFSAFTVIFGHENIAKKLVNWACLFLVIGVIIKVIQFLVEKD